MKKGTNVLALLLCGIFLAACGSRNAEFKITEEVEQQEREEVNAMMGHFASDGENIYMIGGDIIYRVDTEKEELVVNCGDFLCSHESMDCSARLPYRDAFYEIKRNGDHVYVIGNGIYEIGENSKKRIGDGEYGNYENKILFGDYIAYFEKEDVIVVKNIKTNKEVRRFEGIRGYVQGSFYYKDNLYYITDAQQLVRLNLHSGKKEVLEKKGATRASVYNGFIYYIAVSVETDTNCLIKMNPETLEKQELLENLFYYNILDEKLYYTSYPEGHLCCLELDGENRRELSAGAEVQCGWLWAFPQTKVLLLGEDAYTYYLFDVASGKIDYENPLTRPGKVGGEEIPNWMLGEGAAGN